MVVHIPRCVRCRAAHRLEAIVFVSPFAAITIGFTLFMLLADEPPLPDARGRLTGYLACLPGVAVGWLASKLVLLVKGTRSISHGSTYPDVINPRTMAPRWREAAPDPSEAHRPRP